MNGSRQRNAGSAEEATQGGAAQRDFAWVEASVWTERMLSALGNGVKGGKWFSLMDKVFAPKTLAAAWTKVRANKGAAGVDGQSIERFAAKAEDYLAELSAALREGSYRPQAVKRVDIPKGGDGAPWIVGQIEQQFGDQGCYLIDFYHVCEYLGAASAAIAPDPVARDAWIETQKEALKDGRLDAVLQALAGHCEPPEADDEHAPVRTCHRYLRARADQLNYPRALAEGLPIGSGEVESAHRFVAQQRLKRPGAWWRVKHAEHMLALRINRINGDWDAYWKALALQRGAAANDNSPNKSLCRTA